MTIACCPGVKLDVLLREKQIRFAFLLGDCIRAATHNPRARPASSTATSNCDAGGHLRTRCNLRQHRAFRHGVLQGGLLRRLQQRCRSSAARSHGSGGAGDQQIGANQAWANQWGFGDQRVEVPGVELRKGGLRAGGRRVDPGACTTALPTAGGETPPHMSTSSPPWTRRQRWSSELTT
jgi:hypothetical protein